MEYKFNDIEKKWQDYWKNNKVYKVYNPSTGSGQVAKPKYYVLDMFPYPSGAGLHVGHPLGYIASDIYSRYKKLKGFNVLHPMGFDSFGLPAEQYAIETGQHPKVTTEKNIATFKSQLDKIGFCYDWDREVQTSDPSYYKWTQWIFLKLYNSYFCNTQKKARPITELIEKYETKGTSKFTAEQWNNFSVAEKEEWLMQRRLAFSKYGEVNWCEALGTVLANDEVVNGVSERGGHPVEKKKMRQWYLRITSYADRLLKGLETVDFSESMKEMQRNWIGRSEGAEIEFSLTPNPSPGGEGDNAHHFKTADSKWWPQAKDLARENRKEQTDVEKKLWEGLRNNQLGYKVRRQHVIANFIIDFAFLEKNLLIEIDGGYHNDEEQKKYDEARTGYLNELGYRVIRFSNEEVEKKYFDVIHKIKEELNREVQAPLSARRGAGGEAKTLKVYTTRPDTIFGVDFMVIAPEHDLIHEITTPEQKEEVEKYLGYVKSRSERERLAEAKTITGCFTGAYAINPFDGRKIPIWTSEYVLAGYGTGAIMAVPCGDERDHKFAKHFNIPITNIIGSHYNGEEANPTKDAILENSDFLNGLVMKDAIGVAIDKIEELGIGKRKVNYKMRDAGFSRQRYWGEPFPIVWKDGVAYALDEKDLPLELPHVDKYGPGPEGEGPLANITDWVNVKDLTPAPSPKERGVQDDAPYGYINSTKDEWKKTLALAKQNRKNPTEEEDIMWQALRNRNLAGYKFRRQHPIAGFIPDFVCLEKKLIVEIDGGYHNEEEQKKFDSAREEWLKEHGFTMIRISNFAVNNAINSVLDDIEEALLDKEESQKISESQYSPLPGRGAGGEVKRETSTMPGYAGSSWYFLRYMDPNNTNEFCNRQASDYWNQVDVYIGGTEHAVGHLLYSRMWTKVLYDLGLIGFDEPFKRLVNQGMIQGSSRLAIRMQLTGYKISDENILFQSKAFFVSLDLVSDYIDGGDTSASVLFERLKKYSSYLKEISNSYKITGSFTNKLHVHVNHVDGFELDIEKYRIEKPELLETEFICNEQTKFICLGETEKMSKSKYNTVNPDDLCKQYGADTFRMYEMFLGPVEQSKPWDTKGIEGVHRFLKKLWRLFFDELKGKIWNEEKANADELKALHKTIKKIEEDTERFSYNTAVSTFMICVNELTDLKCHKKEILEPLLVLLSPYAPHIVDELYFELTGKSLLQAANESATSVYPVYNPAFTVESEKEYPVSINGKMRTTILLPVDIEQQAAQEAVLQNDIVKKWVEDKPVKKFIFVKNKMVNVVV